MVFLLFLILAKFVFFFMSRFRGSVFRFSLPPGGGSQPASELDPSQGGSLSDALLATRRKSCGPSVARMTGGLDKEAGVLMQSVLEV